MLTKLTQAETPLLVEENRRLHRYLVEGVPVEVRREDGIVSGEHVRLIDFDAPEANDWLAVNQFTVIEGKANRRADVVVFVTACRWASSSSRTPATRTPRSTAPSTSSRPTRRRSRPSSATNVLFVISDGIGARIGSLTADRERFMPWRTVTGGELATKDTPELETMLKGVFDKRSFLELLKDFIVFGDTGAGVIKILAGYHQFHAVRQAVSHTLSATGPEGDRKVGVIWHTQGSGKSLLMAFYAGRSLNTLRWRTPHSLY